MKVKLNKKRTYVTFLLDDSGSMAPVQMATIKGFNDQLKTVKDMATPEHEVLVSVILFSNPYDGIKLVRDKVPAHTVPPISTEEYKANGASTALLDAIDFAMTHADHNGVADKENAALVIITTDGQNNNSQRIREKSFIKRRIEDLMTRGNWTFTYMGIESADAISEGLGIPQGNTIQWQGGVAGAAMNSVTNSDSLTRYASARLKGSTTVANFYDPTKTVDTDENDIINLKTS